MKTFLRSLLAGLLALTLTGPVAVAEERPAFSDEELDQMLAPIALYPDSLLSHILMASTYPLEVVQAARWSRANSQLKGDDAVKAVEGMDWEPSVKSLVAFPQILQRMDERLDWTQRLGEAFLAQEPHVLDTIQGLRQKAATAGNLNSNEHMRVTRQDDAILIEPARPEAVYVPYYNPAVAYGPWGYPAYPPVYWAPFPGYYAAPAFSPFFFWGPAIVVSTGFFFGHTDFHHHHAKVHHHHGHPAHAKPHQTTAYGKPVAWQHNPTHRKGVPYRHASLRDQYSGRSGPGMRGGDGRRDRGPGAAPNNNNARRADGQPGSRDGRPETRRDFVGDRGGREAAPQQPSTKGSTAPANSAQQPSTRGSNAPANSGSRSPGSANPSGSGSDRRSDAGRDHSRSNDHRAGPAPATRQQPQRADSNGNNNVLRFPTPQARPSAPVARHDTNGNNVHRSQGHAPAPRSAPSAPAARQNHRAPVAAPQRSGQQAAGRQQQFRQPQAAGHGGSAPRQVAMPQRMAPPPQAQARGGSAPRMANNGNGNFRGGGGGNRGGGSFR
jgi:hypothetical protein